MAFKSDIASIEAPIGASDDIELIVLDHSGDEFSTSYEACTAFELGECRRIKVVVDLTTKGSVTKITANCRTSTKAAPNKDTAADWATRQWHASPGEANQLELTAYEPYITVAAAGRFEFMFDSDGLWCSPQIKVDAATGSRGTVYIYRSRARG